MKDVSSCINFASATDIIRSEIPSLITSVPVCTARRTGRHTHSDFSALIKPARLHRSLRKRPIKFKFKSTYGMIIDEYEIIVSLHDI